MAVVGYARTTITEPSADPQLDMLNEAGCDPVYVDTPTGNLERSPELDLVIKEELRPGDTLVVCRLASLATSLPRLTQTVAELTAHQIGLHSLHDNIDTTADDSRLVLHVLAAIADFRHDTVRERTHVGLANARAEGRAGGRPIVMTPDKVTVARNMNNSRHHSHDEIARVLGVSRSSIYRILTPTDPATRPPHAK